MPFLCNGSMRFPYFIRHGTEDFIRIQYCHKFLQSYKHLDSLSNNIYYGSDN